MRDAMRSIRLRLLLSLLVVLGLVLGWVSWSAYALARYSLEVRQNGIREMLQARYESAEREERERFDESLLHQAHALAGIARLQWRWPRLRFFALGCLTAVLDANAFATVPIWLGQDAYTPLALRLHWLVAPNLEISEEFFVEGEEELYYQFTFPNGEVLHYSPNLSEPWRLPTTWREQLRLLEPYYDEIQSPKGEPMRRVTVRVPVSRWRFFLWRGWPAERSGPSGRGRPSEFPGRTLRPPTPGKPPVGNLPPFVDQSAPQLFISVARSTAPLAEKLERLAQRRDEGWRQSEADTRSALRSFGLLLLLTNLATFAGAGIGGWALIRKNLKPLARIADAVSQVNEKTFSLPLDGQPVPRELVPIVEKLQQTLRSLQQAFEREKQAIADISHDLRTPIAALLTTLEVSLRRPRSAEEYRATLENCQRIGRQLRHLAERVLALARLDAGVDQVRRHWFDLAALVEDCIRTVEPLAKQQQVALSASVPSVLCYTDAAKLRDILINLLDNAVQYNRPSGSVQVSAEQNNGSLYIEVQDTGVGMTEEVRARIFQRFYRADTSRGESDGHAGLGLAIVQGYVNMLGGRIEVESQPGRGSTFRIYLPARETCPSSAAEPV
jgi:signal transduction histidine kinase